MKLNLMAFLFCLCTMICGTAFAYTPPVPTGYVTDTTGSLSTSQVAQLNSKISDFNKRTQNEVAVLIIKSIDDSNIEDVTHDTFKAWRVGKAGLDNGVLLVLAIESRKMRLQTGKGVEGDITDLQASDVLASMKPGLRNKDYYGAVSMATDKIMGLLESRHGQKVDPGQGAQFNKPLPAPETSTAPVVHTPVSASCAVGAVGAETSGLTWVAGVILLLVAGIIFARFMIRRSARLTMEALERKVEAEMAAERAVNERRLAIAKSEAEAKARRELAAKLDEENKRLAQAAASVKNVTVQTIQQPVKVVIPTPVPRPTQTKVQKAIVSSEGQFEANRRAAQSAQAVRNQKVIDAATSGTALVAIPSPREFTDAAAAKAKREAESRKAEARRQEELEERERSAQRARREEEARDEDRARKRREEEDRRNSYSSSSSDSSWGGSSSDSGFGGGDSGGGGSSNDW